MTKRRRRRQQQPEILHHDPPVRWQDVGVTIRCGEFWPDDVPMPDGYIKPRPMPCPKCRRVYKANGRRAVLGMGVKDTIAYFHAACCNHSFSMPAR